MVTRSFAQLGWMGDAEAVSALGTAAHHLMEANDLLELSAAEVLDVLGFGPDDPDLTDGEASAIVGWLVEPYPGLPPGALAAGLAVVTSRLASYAADSCFEDSIEWKDAVDLAIDAALVPDHATA